ncbi:MAG: addiction module protein [Candidatus Eisenbacteria sp.]|nr:addiction module protein [Candidatus Eisenbacteria bacterium]
MANDPAKILQEALKLPPEARAALAGWLLDSLDSVSDDDAEDRWSDEISRRIQELDSAIVKAVPWSVARRTISDA